MKVSRLVGSIGLVLATAGSAAAQSVTLEFKDDGHVKLVTQNAPISAILAEWGRRGHTTIVNGERVPGPPLTLELVDVTERQALEILLRDVSGYLSAVRNTPMPGASAYDRILIVPTSRVTTGSTAQPSPAAQAAAQALQNRIIEDDDDAAPPPPPGQRVPPVNLPPGVRLPQQQPPQQQPPQQQEPNRLPQTDEPEQQRPATTPSNPFGVAPGSATPGVITPAPRQNSR
ncbi:MAG TPA: hypothetical protein VKB50_32340 [Vicinamibacterales bacterium]|nr:hypothetical protein [Vicinamibacterales bacterium]